MAPMSYDSSRLIDTACIGFAHVNGPHLTSLRAVHQAAVQAQFQVCSADVSEVLQKYITPTEIHK